MRDWWSTWFPLQPDRIASRPRESLSKLKHPLSTEGPTDAVRKSAKVGARQVRLVIAWIEMVRDVEHLQSDRGGVIEDAQPFAHLHIERHEGRIPAGLIPRSHEIPVGIDDCQREP